MTEQNDDQKDKELDQRTDELNQRSKEINQRAEQLDKKTKEFNDLRKKERNDKLFQILLVVLGAVITAAATIFATYTASINITIRQENAAIIATATQEKLDIINAPTPTNYPTQTPYPTSTDQPTYTPYPTFTDVPTATTIPTPDALFKDEFSDNRNLWDLQDNIRFSQERLSVTVAPHKMMWLTIPNLSITGINFYIQADMVESGGNCNQSYGYAVGEKDISYHTFILKNICDGFGFLQAFDTFSDNGKELFYTEIKDNKPDLRKNHIVALQVQNGFYTLLYDGIVTDTQQIKPHGGTIGFFAWNNDDSGLRNYSFDNVVVRQIP